MNNKKKTKAQRSNYQKYFPMIIFISILFMGVGYAVINSINLNIDGEAIAKEQSGVYITEAAITSNTNANTTTSKVNSVLQTTMNSTSVLSSTDASSSLSYTIKVYNSSEYIYTFVDTVYDSEHYSNENIVFELTGLEPGDTINPGEYLTFTVKFYYNSSTITNNTLDSIINFEFSNNTWNGITAYGVSSFEVLNSKKMDFATIRVKNVSSQFEKVNIPLENLEVGTLYQLTYKTSNSSGIITTNANNLMYGCTVMPSPSTDYTTSSKTIGNVGYNSGFLWKTKNLSEQTATITFKATTSTMYWIWDMSGISDIITDLYLKDIKLTKTQKPTTTPYIDFPNASIYQNESVASGGTPTLTVNQGTYLTKTTYDEVLLKIQSASGFEFLNTPIVGLTVGNTYKISFSNYTSPSTKSTWNYGATVKDAKREIGGQLVTDSDYLITDFSIVNEGSITFTATASTMYFIWDFGGLADKNWFDVHIYNVTITKA